ncbi:hypothetical protein [Streptomyces sp. NPDC047130]|uniref:hypothetical protein n=1 Tax=Streptomyces sp. NPDC047130 TaxID=3155261 RepID=UPI0033EA963F
MLTATTKGGHDTRRTRRRDDVTQLLWTLAVEWTDGERRRVTVRSDQRAYPFAAAVGRSLDAMLSAGPAR